jgi:hypothetical protein
MQVVPRGVRGQTTCQSSLAEVRWGLLASHVTGHVPLASNNRSALSSAQVFSSRSMLDACRELERPFERV